MIAVLLVPASAEAARPLSLGIYDSWSRTEGPVLDDVLLGEAKAAGAQLAFNSINWSTVAPTSPDSDFDARDPSDPGYRWGGTDNFVRNADDLGLDLVFLISTAPDWAEGSDRAPGAPAGTWKPEPRDLADFATAIATRYSGEFVDPNAPELGPLPRVGYFQAWAEANLSTKLSPQWSGAKRPGPPQPLSPGIYRKMLNAFDGAIKRVDPQMKVITSGTAPYGDAPGGRRMRPLDFWSEVLCARRSSGGGKGCPNARFDIFAHHPINTSGRPTKEPANPADVSSGNFGDLVDLLRKTERGGPKAAPGRHPVWVTEFWYRSDPPESRLGLPLTKQAKYVSESLYLFWKAGAEAAFNLLVRDGEGDPGSVIDPVGSGLYFADGSEKPAARAFRFPFVAQRIKGRRVEIWGKAPSSGDVAIEMRKRDGAWRRIELLEAGVNRVFVAKRKIAGKPVLRAVSAGEASMSWKVEGA